MRKIFLEKANQNVKKRSRNDQRKSPSPTSSSRAPKQRTPLTRTKVVKAAQNSQPSPDLSSEEVSYDDIYRDIKNPAAYSSNVRVLV